MMNFSWLSNNLGRKNMDYKELYFHLICSEEEDRIFPYSSPAELGVVYDLGTSWRASAQTLMLRPNFKRRCAIPHLVNDEILVSQAFYSSESENAVKDQDPIVIYCAWREAKPNIVSLWARDKTNGILSVPPKCFKPIEEIARLKDCFFKMSITGKITTTEKSEAAALVASRFVIDQTLRDMLSDVEHVKFVSEDEFDSSGTIREFRSTFFSIEKLFDLILIKRSCAARNHEKEWLVELKCAWECAIKEARKLPAARALPIGEWLPAAWLQIIGAPAVVRTHEEMVALICGTILPLSCVWTENAIARALVSVGFRPKFALWVGVQIVTDIFDFDLHLEQIATPISWNSYLLSKDNQVHFTHVHPDESDFVTTGLTKLNLSVVGENTSLKVDIGAVPLKFGDSDLNQADSVAWSAKSYSIKVFDYIQEKLASAQTQCFYGHCCSEQAVVQMSISGLSPFAGCANRMSCGHGMYFFRMGATSQTFDELTTLATDQNNSDTVVKDFRGFLYALSLIFRGGSANSLSPAIVLFMIPTEKINPFDTESDLLPLQKNCTCPGKISGSIDGETVQLDATVDLASAKDVVKAINMIDSEKTLRCKEKVNAFALLSGAVDFDTFAKIPHHLGVFKGNICDNSFRYKALPYDVIANWDDPIQFDVWKKQISEEVTVYRRPIMTFDDVGQFKLNRNSDDRCTVSATEYVFVSVGSLMQLMNNATTTSVCFIDPTFHVRKDDVHRCDREQAIRMTESWAMTRHLAPRASKSHPYWLLKNLCCYNHPALEEKQQPKETGGGSSSHVETAERIL